MTAPRRRLAFRVMAGLVAGGVLCVLALACNFVVGDGDYKVGSKCTVSTTDGTCAQCLEAKCCDPFAACLGDNNCIALQKCIGACPDTNCITGCDGQYSSATVSEVNALVNCANAKCPMCALAGIGDPCTQNSDCATNSCLGRWCSQVCTHDSECAGNGTGGTNSVGQHNACVTNNLNVNQCFPGCMSTADCSGFANTTCQAVYSTDNNLLNVCSTTVADAGH